VLNLLYFYISTFRSMCAVPNMAVFCSSLTSCFPGMLLTYFPDDSEIVPVAALLLLLLLLLLLPPFTRGTALQTGRLRDRFQVVSLEFFIDVFLPAALWPWGRLSI